MILSRSDMNITLYYHPASQSIHLYITKDSGGGFTTCLEKIRDGLILGRMEVEGESFLKRLKNPTKPLIFLRRTIRSIEKNSLSNFDIR